MKLKSQGSHVTIYLTPVSSHFRVLQSEIVQNVSSDARSGGGSERHDGHVPVSVTQLAQPGVVGSEVVSPLGHTVSLVDNEPGGLVYTVRIGIRI